MALAAADDFIDLLTLHWASCDNLHTWTPSIHAILFEAKSVGRYPLSLRAYPGSPDPATIYANLPPLVKIWRGCYANNVLGTSWSLEKRVALRFPFLTRYRRANAQRAAVLVEGCVRKADIALIVVDRKEAEVVKLPSDVKIVQQAPAWDTIVSEGIDVRL